MSRIKDLFAIENGDDDLVPSEDNTMLSDYEKAVQKKITAELSDIKKGMLDVAEFGVGTDDEGHEEIYFENFYNLCHSVAERYIEEPIEEEQVDLNDEQFTLLNAWVGDWLADVLADWETEQCDEAKQNIKE